MNLSGLKSIRFRLPALFLLAALLPALLSALWSSQLLKQRMQAMFSEQARESVEIAHNLFEEYQQDILLKTRIISQTRAIQELILNYSELDLINQLSILYQDLNLQLYDAVIEIYAPQGHLIAAEPRLGRRLTPKDHIQAALRGEFRQARLFVADDLLIAATLPIYHPSRPEPIAVLGVNLRITHKLADAISKISGSDILILRKQHPWKVLASTLDEQTAQNLALRLEQEGTALQINARQPYLLSALPQQARQGEFLLVVALSMAGMHRMIHSIQQILMVVEVGAIILALLIAFGLSRNFIAKLMELVRLARRVESGELETPVRIESGDEFGVLARTLDSMREKIRSTLQDKERMIAKLTIQDAINQALITRSGNELLMQVLEVIISAIQARQGSIMLVDHESGRLLLKVVYNSRTDTQPVNVHEHISFALGEGIAGYVAQSGEAVLGNDPPFRIPALSPIIFRKWTSAWIICSVCRSGWSPSPWG